MAHDITLLIASSIQESLKVKQALLNDADLQGLLATVSKQFVSALSRGRKILLLSQIVELELFGK